MHLEDEENKIFAIAATLINESNRPVFLTGKAGTGKTTFLKFIRENSTKNIAVVAPTGVAAINAGGTTIHSFFNLPFSPFIPERIKSSGEEALNDKHSLAGKLRLSNERKELIRELELLVIDEISMVRCDVLDAIDQVLRLVRSEHRKPFGGVQLLYIGDIYQLPPVVKDDEWNLLKSFYVNPYFFSAKAIEAQQPVYIELQKVYRQSDLAFIALLNKVRNNEMDEEGYAQLESRYNPGFEPEEKDNYITLTTHNSKADHINQFELGKINNKPFSFQANIEGLFNENAYPADEMLTLKIGARVMFIKNDLEKTRRYYNGKIGTVHKIEGDKIWIECLGENESQLIETKKETWRNIRYSLNQKTRQIEEEELGSFTQYPLRLAWAITIHKSQGLTFEKAVIDAGNAFSPGQVYVALSRCTKLEGLVLKSKIALKSLYSDERVVEFSVNQKRGLHVSVLEEAQKEYQQEIIKKIFDFSSMEKMATALVAWNNENRAFNENVSVWLNNLSNKLKVFSNHSSAFKPALETYFSEPLMPEKNEDLKKRLQKASEWFIAEMKATQKTLLESPALTDNRQLAHEYKVLLNKIFDALSLQTHLMGCCTNGFSMSVYRQLKMNYQKEIFRMNAYSGAAVSSVSSEVKNPALYLSLKEKRNRLAEEKNCPVYLVCSTASIEQMAEFLPVTLQDLGKISGFGNIKVKQYGNEFIEIIRAYCEANNLVSNPALIPSKKIRKEKNNPVKSDTKKETFDLYKQGKTLQEISAARNLSLSTIEGHLAHFISSGEINIDQLMDPHKQMLVKKVIVTAGTMSLGSLKAALGDHISYAELKWVMAAEKLT